MNASVYYQNAIPFSLAGTPFDAVFDAADGGSTDPDWYKAIDQLVNDGAKPVFNSNVPDEVCARAWMDLAEQLGFMPNIFSVKISLAAGICTKEDIVSVFSKNKEWIDQASFRGALSDFLGVHNTRIVPLSMVVGREVGTSKLIQTFSDPESTSIFMQEKNIMNLS